MPSPGQLPTFSVASGAGGSSLPFAFGHVFREGDVPAGRFIESDLADWQATPTAFWPDGSVRHAVIAGLATCVAGEVKAIALSVSATNRASAELTETNLAAVLPSVTLTAGGETITLKSLVGTTARHRTVCVGPIMANWIYRKPLAGSNHLVAWFDVRLFKGGNIEIFPWIENGYLFVADPTNDVRTYTLSIDGIQKFSAEIDIKHHTRVALLDNTSTAFKHWSYWAGIDPQIEPRHNTAYMMATKMVPNYGWPVNEATVAKLLQTYHPNSMGNVPGGMGSANHLSYVGIIPPWAVTYLASAGDARGYRALIQNGLASGAWSIHYRDESTEQPFKFGSYPKIWISHPDPTNRPPTGTGGVNRDKGGFQAVPDVSHQPSLAFVPWLLTGRWFFLDETLFWLTWSHFQLNYVERESADGIQFMSTQRSRARFLRTCAQALATLTPTHPCYPDVLNVWEKNMKAYHERYITGTRDNGAYLNKLGSVGTYTGRSKVESAYYTGHTSGYFWDPPWQIANLTLALAISWDLNLPQSAESKAQHLAIRNFGYTLPVGLAGDGSPGTYSYRRFAMFEMPIGTDQFGIPPDNWLPDLGAVYAVSEAHGIDGVTPMPPLPPGNTIVYKDAGPIGSSHWSSHSAVIYSYACLALAVEHGAPGASAAWERITGSDSWAFAGAGFRSNPTWGYWPRNR